MSAGGNPPPKSSRTSSTVMMATTGANDEGPFIPDLGRRRLMNAFLLGSISGPLLTVAGVLVAYLTPAKAGGGSAGTAARDKDGNNIKLTAWKSTHKDGDRQLV